MTRLRSANNLSDIDDAAAAREHLDTLSIDEFEILLAGHSIEMQLTATHVQYRYPGGAWTDLTPLSILSGEDGKGGSAARWLTGEAVPDITEGDAGDFYLRTNGHVYKKASSWSLIAELKGTPGESAVSTTWFLIEDLVPPGDLIANGYPIKEDDFCVVASGAESGNVYQNVNDQWAFVMNLVGETGTRCLQARGAPTAALGVNGDFYFAVGGTVNGYLYRKVAGAWEFVVDTTGAAGDDMADDLELDAMAVGTYLFGRLATMLWNVSFGDQVDGALLMPTDTEGNGDDSQVLPGTWVCLGYAQSSASAPANSPNYAFATTLWMRVN